MMLVFLPLKRERERETTKQLHILHSLALLLTLNLLFYVLHYNAERRS